MLHPVSQWQPRLCAHSESLTGFVLYAPQTVARIRKLVSTAEAEYRSAVNAIQPLEATLLDLKRQLDEAMGADKLGSLLDLEDVDVVGQKEREMVRVFTLGCVCCTGFPSHLGNACACGLICCGQAPMLQAREARLNDAKQYRLLIGKYTGAANDGLVYWRSRLAEAEALVRGREKRLDELMTLEVRQKAARFENWKQVRPLRRVRCCDA
jgi:hypothetical protein